VAKSRPPIWEDFQY